VITALACSLVGQTHGVAVRPGTRAAQLYGADEVTEDYYCNYGVNPDYRRRLEDGGLRVSGVGADDEVRIVELPAHPFFLATLFLPQARSTAAAPHPLLVGFAAAVAAHGAVR
jgi:CTP synthase (UTP-ammonia lyase)